MKRKHKTILRRKRNKQEWLDYNTAFERHSAKILEVKGIKSDLRCFKTVVLVLFLLCVALWLLAVDFYVCIVRCLVVFNMSRIY